MNFKSSVSHPICFIIVVSFAIGAGCTPMPIYTSKNRKPPKSVPAVKKTTKKTEKDQKKPIKESNHKSFKKGQVLKGITSYYGPGFHGKLTANGEIYNQNALTCAHKSLPFGTILKVTLLETGKSVKVRVNDRGPYVGDRVIDLSVEAARRIGLIKKGTGEVSAIILKLGDN
ncbi:MAG: septal ring lytic transglycosylase RlpA family protein [Candidatus Electryonea clarkiae]|nr:septal ring lytic transglycosylase RlpA family protein [Candidatus Electryonea clarkiae]MDP8288091.1 septal ring lytic transglycosylase RlpA family protein [Candidatus Electryonea clarkiae]